MEKTKGLNKKLIFLKQILERESDEQHMLTTKELIQKLGEKGIRETAQTLRRDLARLRETGCDIIMYPAGKNTGYFIGERSLELAHLKILCDLAYASRSISAKQLDKLIENLSVHTSKYNAKYLERDIILGRPRTTNDRLFYAVDAVYRAITGAHPITFYYLQWNLDGKLERKYGGREYRVSPWALIYEEGSYYMVAFDHYEEKIKHYRVDKMEQIDVVEKEERRGMEAFSDENIAFYAKRHFKMYGGQNEDVTLKCTNAMVNVIFDRFGSNQKIMILDEGHFQATVPIAVSSRFYGWIAGFGEKIQIVAPDRVREGMKRFIVGLYAVYEE